MKLPTPDAAALGGAAQAQIDLDARCHGAAFSSTDLAPVLDPSPTPTPLRGPAPLQLPRLKPAATPAGLHLCGAYR